MPTTKPPKPDNPHPASLLQHPVHVIPSLGEQSAQKLAEVGVSTCADLLHILPKRYFIRQALYHIEEIVDGARISVVGVVQQKHFHARGPRGARLQATLADETGTLQMIWFHKMAQVQNQKLLLGQHYEVRGTARFYQRQIQLVHPECTLCTEIDTTTQTRAIAPEIVPIYPDVQGISPLRLREWIRYVLPYAQDMFEPLPAHIRRHYGFPTLGEALHFLHAPSSTVPTNLNQTLSQLQASSTPAQRRFIYSDWLLFQLQREEQRRAYHQQKALALSAATPPLTDLAHALLPFQLTEGQRSVLEALNLDLRCPQPMQRLLQGDVGCGKTAVAMVAAFAFARQGWQSLLMAPTELLAEQHYQTACKLFQQHAALRVVRLTGHLKSAERRASLAAIAEGQAHIVLGTHALIGEQVRFQRLALAVVDEQHRFGVMQRARLLELNPPGELCRPHVLLMTATPIPRTLAMTAFADLDISRVKGMPPGRKPVQTYVLREHLREKAYRRIGAWISDKKCQVYVVFPLIEASEHDDMQHVHAATESFLELSQGPLSQFRLALLHGRMSAAEKESIMHRFSRHEIDVLVATTVIEVGIDVPNASIIVVEGAERFGLSALHQLRGRVGRGHQQSIAVLIAGQKTSREAWQRLHVLLHHQDGLEVAEADLRMRGPGDFLGLRQSGEPTLCDAHIGLQPDFLEQVREDARQILQDDPHAYPHICRLLRQHIGKKHRFYSSFGAVA